MPAAASVEPTPVAKAPSAPYVQVWESAPMMTSPGTDHALLGQERVLDAHAADLVVVRDALRAREVAHHLGLLGGLDVLVGRVVVGDERDLGRVPHLLDADLARTP